jgi:hypothetical protein
VKIVSTRHLLTQTNAFMGCTTSEFYRGKKAVFF